MTSLLRIDSSARCEGSHSRRLADQVETAWLRAHAGKIIRRDLAAEPVPHIDAVTIQGFFASEEQHTPATRAAVQLSDRLIAEFLAADAILLSAPIYNFGVPSALKAYIDQIVRIGRTFAFDAEKGLFGLVADRPVYVAAVYGAGGYGVNGPATGALSAFNYLEPYLRSLFGFLGIKDLTFFSIEGTSIDPKQAEFDEARALAAIDRLFKVAA